MIMFLCPKPESPSGGVYFIHRLVQLLNQMSISARVVQMEPFEVWWDANPIPKDFIVTPAALSQADTIVVPEVMWPLAGFEQVRKILFVQNRIWLPQEMETYRGGVAETLVCSRYLFNWMRREHGANVIGKLTPFLDDGVWNPTPKTANRTLVMARRNSYHAKMRDALESAGFPVDYVTDSLSQRQLTERLASCEFYVHLNHPEGFPMACLEAMRMGTIVCGTNGSGGVEFMFDHETAMVVQDPENGHYGSAEEFIRRIMEQMEILRADPALRSALWKKAYNWSLRYNAEATKEELRKVFGKK